VSCKRVLLHSKFESVRVSETHNQWNFTDFTKNSQKAVSLLYNTKLKMSLGEKPELCWVSAWWAGILRRCASSAVIWWFGPDESWFAKETVAYERFPRQEVALDIIRLIPEQNAALTVCLWCEGLPFDPVARGICQRHCILGPKERVLHKVNWRQSCLFFKGL